MDDGKDGERVCEKGCGCSGGCCPGKREAIILAVVAMAVIGFSYAYYLL